MTDDNPTPTEEVHPFESAGSNDFIPPPQPPSSDNRAFLIVAGILGGIGVLALICIVVIMLIFLPRKRAQDQARIEAVNAQNTQVAMMINQTQTSAAQTAAVTPTDTPTPVPPTPTETQVVKLAPTQLPTEDPRTGTVAALYTQAAQITRTVIPFTPVPTPTALPRTGFAEDAGRFGLPTLIGLAILFLAIIFIARQARTRIG